MTLSRSLVAAVALFVPCTLAAALRGQDLAISRVLVDRTFTVFTEQRGVPAISTTVSANTDVTAGLAVQSNGSVGNASVSGWFQRADQALDCRLSANCLANGFLSAGAASGVGQPSVLVELTVPRPMTVRFLARAAAAVSPGAPPCRGVVDVGADDQPEIDFVVRAGICVATESTVELALPAGTVAIRLAVDAELPGAAVGNQASCSSIFTSVHIEPAHATVSWEGPTCGNFVDAMPMLDGTSVRFGVGPISNAPRWLVLGASPADALIPHAPFCSLLVSPDVVLPMSPSAWTTLPLGLLGPGEVFAQGVALQPATPWQPAPLLLTSSRVRVQLR